MIGRRARSLAAAMAVIASSPHAQAPSLRFHHVHLRVADPASAMALYIRSNGCSSVLLQGVGVGVQCGQAYLLFDRSDQSTGHVTRGAVSVTGKGERATIRVRVAARNLDEAKGWFPD